MQLERLRAPRQHPRQHTQEVHATDCSDEQVKSNRASTASGLANAPQALPPRTPLALVGERSCSGTPRRSAAAVKCEAQFRAEWGCVPAPPHHAHSRWVGFPEHGRIAPRPRSRQLTVRVRVAPQALMMFAIAMAGVVLWHVKIRRCARCPSACRTRRASHVPGDDLPCALSGALWSQHIVTAQSHASGWVTRTMCEGPTTAHQDGSCTAGRSCRKQRTRLVAPQVIIMEWEAFLHPTERATDVRRGGCGSPRRPLAAHELMVPATADHSMMSSLWHRARGYDTI